MILPIYLYGSPVLRKVAEDIDQNYPDWDVFIKDFWETMYHADGVGLAAPQVGRSIRLFVVDASGLEENYPEAKGFKQAFINPQIIASEGKVWEYNEGCLSVPGIHEDVKRPDRVRVQYLDEQFKPHDEWFEGICGRIVQHEYDHLEGKVFVDHLSPIRKQLLKSKLNKIERGDVHTSYRVKRG